MKQISKAIIVVVFASVVLTLQNCAEKQTGDTFRVFFLGGQSNMEGFGYNRDLPPALIKPLSNVYIFHGNPAGDNNPAGGLGKWENLRPGHGTEFVSDGQTNTTSSRFGVEMMFAKRMQELYPNEKIAIIKYARNGSSIDSLAAAEWGSWQADFKTSDNQYDYFLKTVSGALQVKDINGDGKTDQLLPTGILWMQGEADGAFTEAIANRYYGNLKKLMGLMRSVFEQPDLPVVVGQISDSGNAEGGRVWKFGELIQSAQQKFAKTDGNAAIVTSTSTYKYSDPWHYDSAGYLDLGKNFSEAISRLRKSKK